MIALLLATTIAPPFAPRPGPITYTVRDIYSERPHEAVTTTETLSFSREGGSLVAHLIPLSREIEAPPAAREAAARLFAPMAGVESKLALDPHGRPGAPIDSDKPWAAFLASRAALRAKVDADPAVPPETRATAHRLWDAEIAPAARDERLRDPFLQILPPQLPPLAIGDSDDFAATIAAAGGAMPANGKIALLAADGPLLRYRITMATAPIAPASAYYSETNDLAIDRATGLLATAHRLRTLVFPDGHTRPVTIEDIARLP